jgi:excisionase family DNA binding protein
MPSDYLRQWIEPELARAPKLTDEERKQSPPTRGNVKGDGALWTPAMLSRYLGIPVATLYQWRQRGVGPPAIRLGKHIRYRPEAVREWLKSQEEPHGTHR